MNSTGCTAHDIFDHPISCDSACGFIQRAHHDEGHDTMDGGAVPPDLACDASCPLLKPAVLNGGGGSLV